MKNNDSIGFIFVMIILVSCNESPREYPQIIIDNKLEELYDQSILDWHLLNSTSTFSESFYLLEIDSVLEKKIYKRDSTTNTLVLDRRLILNKEKMKELFPNNVIDFPCVELVLFENEEFSITRGDTIIIALFPEIEGKEYSMLYDPIDGYIHTIYYLGSRIIRVGRNDYTEFDIDDREVRSLEAKINKIISVDNDCINPRLKNLLSEIK